MKLERALTPTRLTLNPLTPQDALSPEMGPPQDRMLSHLAITLTGTWSAAETIRLMLQAAPGPGDQPMHMLLTCHMVM